MLMNLALPTLIILSLIALLLYMFISIYKNVYTLSFAMHVFGMGIVVPGVSGIKPAGEDVFGYLGGGELETTDLGSGIGVHSSVYPYFDSFRSLGVGVLLALGGYELAPV
jgi:hypothetical protein